MTRIATLTSIGLCVTLLVGCASPGAKQTSSARSAAFTAYNNPTFNDGRGEPTLEDIHAPAVWVFVDGHAGRFLDNENDPMTPWIVEADIGPEPTFRVEAFGPLLGAPRDFSCVLSVVENQDGSSTAYAIKADEGSFRVGKTYSLLRPGKNFVVRNLQTGDVVNEIAPLTPGTYMLAAGVKNTKTGKEGLAISHFTVR